MSMIEALSYEVIAPCDTGDSVFLLEQGDAIAGKPAPTVWIVFDSNVEALHRNFRQ
jgi:hypothetical protein